MDSHEVFRRYAMFYEQLRKMQDNNQISIELKHHCNVVTDVNEMLVPAFHVIQTYVDFIWYNIDITREYIISFPDSVNTLGLFFIKDFFKPALKIHRNKPCTAKLLVKNLSVPSNKVLEDHIRQILTQILIHENEEDI